MLCAIVLINGLIPRDVDGNKDNTYEENKYQPDNGSELDQVS